MGNTREGFPMPPLDYIATSTRARVSGCIPDENGDIVWKMSGSCTAPTKISSKSQEVFHNGKLKALPRYVTLVVRCRKCTACRLTRSWAWSDRAAMEAAKGGRVWWCTFTLKPEFAYHAELQAIAQAKREKQDFWKLDARKQFALRTKYCRTHLTKVFMRMRKGLKSGYFNSNILDLETGKAQAEVIPPLKFRTLVVAEPHKTGIPHFHALIFEGQQEIKALWMRHYAQDMGRNSFELCKSPIKASRYVTGYLSKSPISIISASLGFGNVSKVSRRNPF